MIIFKLFFTGLVCLIPLLILLKFSEDEYGETAFSMGVYGLILLDFVMLFCLIMLMIWM